MAASEDPIAETIDETTKSCFGVVVTFSLLIGSLFSFSAAVYIAL